MVETIQIKANGQIDTKGQSKKYTKEAVERIAFAANKVVTSYVDRTSRVGEVAAAVASMGGIVISYEFLLNNFSSASPEYFQKYQLPLIAAVCVAPSVLIGGILGKRFGLR